MVKSKPRMGKQKIEMKRIQDEVRRQVCFSKRRSGVFKKANELSILCGAEVAIVVFSPGGNPYSFGHPSISSVINHFLLDGIRGNPTISNNGQGSSGATSTLHELIREHAKLEKMIEAEKCRGKKIQEAIEKEIQEMGLDELEKLKEELVGQHDMINTRKIQLMKERAIKAFQDAVMGIYGPPQFPLGSQGASQLGVNPTPDSGTSGAGAFGHGLNGNFAM